MIYFDDKTILITGAEGGLGGELVAQLQATSAQLVLSDRTQARQYAKGKIVAFIEGDLSTVQGCKALVARSYNHVEKIDILINNAGIATVGELADIPIAESERTLFINLIAPMQLTQSILPGMIERRRGHIVNISSLAGHIPVPKTTTYTASKHGLRGFGAALRSELKDCNIKVSTVYPSFTQTPILESPRYGYNQTQQLPGFLIDKKAEVVATMLQEIADGKEEIFPSFRANVLGSIARLGHGVVGALTSQLLRVVN